MDGSLNVVVGWSDIFSTLLTSRWRRASPHHRPYPHLAARFYGSPRHFHPPPTATTHHCAPTACRAPYLPRRSVPTAVNASLLQRSTLPHHALLATCHPTTRCRWRRPPDGHGKRCAAPTTHLPLSIPGCKTKHARRAYLQQRRGGVAPIRRHSVALVTNNGAGGELRMWRRAHGVNDIIHNINNVTAKKAHTGPRHP